MAQRRLQAFSASRQNLYGLPDTRPPEIDDGCHDANMQPLPKCSIAKEISVHLTFGLKKQSVCLYLAQMKFVFVEFNSDAVEIPGVINMQVWDRTVRPTHPPQFVCSLVCLQ